MIDSGADGHGTARANPSAVRARQIRAARRFYLEDASKVEIGRELGISRFQVARLLQSARATGVVRIHIDEVHATRDDLARDLTRAFNLQMAAVLDAAPVDTVEQRRASLGALAAQQLHSMLSPDDVLGLPWSRSVSATVAALSSLPPVDVVQLSGARWEPDHSSAPADVVRDATALSGGRPYRFHAPFVASDATAAASLRRDPAFLAAQERVPAITVAVVGVGAFDPEFSTLYTAATSAEIAELRAAGAVGEVSGVFIDVDGYPLSGSFARRLLTVSADQLRGIPDVIGVCMGDERAGAVAAACRGGLLKSLVVDVPLAQALLRGD
ncbi:sugar-binding transcriptional regulator [Allobranchiibius sp. CTAmp26]|uniref:sugar-binding transcriptional regulator n=1 Tax=Allobranchiibius sp. CTAmp26 TaxID=2815214 RepID=UPI001AA0FF0F|nr:sugar-binding domain-containing protein [Allobranchiibius sp. CTAmp26]MBO1754474.1 hypothetical protein [Allobranchiibius sp. CTAmp26]